MADPRHILGGRAEDAAAAWLQSLGWILLARRFRSRGGGEVDLVLLDRGRALIGVEVRARSSARFGAPEESVDTWRAQRIARSVATFAAEAGVRHTGLRVDLVTVEPVSGFPAGRLRLRRLADITGGASVSRRRSVRER